jgi:hypothetical protein
MPISCLIIRIFLANYASRKARHFRQALMEKEIMEQLNTQVMEAKFKPQRALKKLFAFFMSAVFSTALLGQTDLFNKLLD